MTYKDKGIENEHKTQSIAWKSYEKCLFDIDDIGSAWNTIIFAFKISV